MGADGGSVDREMDRDGDGGMVLHPRIYLLDDEALDKRPFSQSDYSGLLKALGLVLAIAGVKMLGVYQGKLLAVAEGV